MTTASLPTSKYDRSIIEGAIGPAVWRLAWPTMLQHIIAGLQRIIDHVMTIAKQIAEALEAAHETGHHPPRPQAREHQSPRRRDGETLDPT